MRFVPINNGLLRDTTTGLVWFKDAGYYGIKTWKEANTLFENSYWRLPTIKELQTLIDYTQYEPALPKDHPFDNVQPSCYWSSTTGVHYTDYAWSVGMHYGYVYYYYVGDPCYVWPVRREQNENLKS